MRGKKEREELQSRREFFKKAAKGALPILGAIVLAGTPAIMKAAEESPMGCRYGCSASCLGNCRGSCYTTCNASCQGSCRGTCLNHCSGTCTGTCAYGCGHSSR